MAVVGEVRMLARDAQNSVGEHDGSLCIMVQHF